MSFSGSFGILLDLGVLYLLVLFSFGFALLVLLGPPTWRLPVSGHVVDLVTVDVGAEWETVDGGAAQEVFWVGGSGPGRKRIFD